MSLDTTTPLARATAGSHLDHERLRADASDLPRLLGTADPDEITIAVHEAGHAVVAILTGNAVRYATLAPRNGLGMVVLRQRRHDLSPSESIPISCAGLIAQDVAGADDRWDIAEMSDAGDITHIRADARAWHAASKDVSVLDLIARSWAIAFDLVVANYGAVLAVAERLLSSRKALTGPEIRACIDGAPTVRAESVPADGRTFWIPEYSGLRSWGPAPSRRRRATSENEPSSGHEPRARRHRGPGLLIPMPNTLFGKDPKP